MLILRLTKALVAAASLLCWPSAVLAQDVFPSRPIRIVVPYAPSGGPDVLTRLIAQRMSETLGQQVIVDNRPGGTGIPAATFVARSAPDGYTVLAIDGNTYGIVPALNEKVPYDVLQDFAPLVQSVSVPLFLVVNAEVPVTSVTELIAYLKANPDTNYGSAGLASIHQLAMEQFLNLAGVRMTHIPYRGAAGVVPALLTGDVKVTFIALPSVSGHVETGKLRILGVAEDKRSTLRPAIPTVAETIPGASLNFTMGYAVPNGTPRAVRERLEGALMEALHSNHVGARLPSLGLDLIAKPSKDYASTILEEREALGRLIRSIKLKLN